MTHREDETPTEWPITTAKRLRRIEVVMRMILAGARGLGLALQRIEAKLDLIVQHHTRDKE